MSYWIYETVSKSLAKNKDNLLGDFVEDPDTEKIEVKKIKGEKRK